MAERKAFLEITCKDCPFRKSTNFWSSDGWDRMEDWVCTKHPEEKRIAGSVEWHEEKNIKVPDWCPLPNTAVK